METRRKRGSKEGDFPKQVDDFGGAQGNSSTEMAAYEGGNPPVAIGQVRRTDHHPRHGVGGTRRGNSVNQQKNLWSQAGIAE